MKYVDENAWSFLIAALYDAKLFTGTQAEREAILNEIPELPDMPAPAPTNNTAVTQQEFVSLRNQINELKDTYRDAEAFELYLANLANLYQLAGIAWSKAYDRVGEITSKETAKQVLTYLPAKLFMGLLKVAISTIPFAKAAGIYQFFEAPLKSALGIQEASLTEVQKELNTRAQGATVKDTFYTVCEATVKELYPPEKNPVTTMIKPSEMFVKLEQNLRMEAVKLRTERQNRTTDPTDYQKSLNDAVSKLGGVGGQNELIRLVLSNATPDELEKKWEIINDILLVQMKRAAWSAYCRASWKKSHWNYKVAVKDERKISDANKLLKAENVNEWPAKAWDSINGWPAHWEDICADFMGPEHLALHACHEQNTPQETEQKRAEISALHLRKSWISLAVVYCCQVKVKVDCEVPPAAGQNAPVAAKTAEKVLFVDLLDKETMQVHKYAGPLLRGASKNTAETGTPLWNYDKHLKLMDVKQPPTYKIDGLSFTDRAPSSFDSPSGKKGKHEMPRNSFECFNAAYGYGGGTIAVHVLGKKSTDANTVTVVAYKIPVSVDEARTVTTKWSVTSANMTAKKWSAREYKFYTNKKGQTEPTEIQNVTKLGLTEPSTKFTYSADSLLKFQMPTEGGFFCFVLTSEVPDLTTSDQCWYVWVQPQPASNG